MDNNWNGGVAKSWMNLFEILTTDTSLGIDINDVKIIQDALNSYRDQRDMKSYSKVNKILSEIKGFQEQGVTQDVDLVSKIMTQAQSKNLLTPYRKMWNSIINEKNDEIDSLEE